MSNDTWQPDIHLEAPTTPIQSRTKHTPKMPSRIPMFRSSSKPLENLNLNRVNRFDFTPHSHYICTLPLSVSMYQSNTLYKHLSIKQLLVTSRSQAHNTMPRIEIGSAADFGRGEALKAALAEFISTLIFVFAGEGSGMAFNKLTDDGSATPAGLVAAALAHGFGLFVAVSVGANISGGHVNPAVTFGALLGGHISVIRGILYWIAQCLGSVVACLLLKFATGGLTTSAFSLSSGVSVWNALVFEIVMTFGLVYTVYATAVDPKKGNIGIIAPLAIGLIVGANILAGGAFDGASMNPAVSFGPAVVSWTWDNHWVYWLGPLVGSAIAALVYDIIFITPANYEQLPTASL